jgi:peptide/nickel transport system substrate-binding protein
MVDVLSSAGPGSTGGAPLGSETPVITRKSLTRLSVIGVATAVALVVAGCTATAPSSSSSGGTLVIDHTFDLKTADPARMYEPTGEITDKALYDTLLTFNGSDVTKPVPDLATMKESADAKTFTFTLKSGRTFSDGTPVTANDVVFSLDRVIGIKGNPSFLLDGVTVTKKNSKTVVLTTAQPDPALPFIIPNPALGILNSKVVKAHGGTTNDKDGAEAYLNKKSAGSGPYVLSSLNLTSQVVFTKNPKYDGTEKPAYGKIVMRNVVSATQKINIEGGDSQVALDLSGDQAAGLGGGTKVLSGASANVIFLLLNQDPAISKFTSNPDFMKAVKEGIDYKGLLAIAGNGAVQSPGVIPSLFLGALSASDELKYDPTAAKADLAKSGYAGQSVTLNFPSDITLNGVQFTDIAQKVQSQLATVGIKVQLAPAPVATELDAYRDGKESIGLWYWGPDYPDPSDYLAFTPGNVVGLRANWKTGDAPAIEALAAQAAKGGTNAQRAAVYQDIQKGINKSGPFIPLFQPANNIAYASSVTGITYNPVWTVDFAALGHK